MSTENKKRVKKDTGPQVAETPAPVEVVEKPTSTALAVVPDAPLSTEVNDFDYGEDAGLGLEGREANDTLIPMIRVLQAQSPQCQDAGRAQEVKAGWLYNTATDVGYPARAEVKEEAAGVLFQPVYVETVFNLWNKREPDGSGGGGLVRTYKAPVAGSSPKQIADWKRCQGYKAEKPLGKIELPPGTMDPADQNTTELVETKNIYGHFLDPDTQEVTELVMIPCESTKITPFKKWFSYVAPPGSKRPLMANKVRITTQLETRGKNKSWNFRFNAVRKPTADGKVADDLFGVSHPNYQAAKALHAAIIAGAMKADVEADQKAAAEADEGGGSVAADDLPY